MMKYQPQWRRPRRERDVAGTLQDITDQKKTAEEKLKGQTPGRHLLMMSLL